MLKVVRVVEEFLVLKSVKNHWTASTYSRSPDETTTLDIFKPYSSLDKLRLEGIFPQNRKPEVFRFDSPFVPLKPFEKDFQKELELQKIWVHFYPNTIKTDKAIIYLHGWGRNSFIVEKNWQFSIIQKTLGADVFAIELPYHNHRNPDPNSFSGQGLLDGDPIRTLEGFRQAVLETELLRNCILACNEYSDVGVVGISLGGHIATLFEMMINNFSRKEEILILAALVGSPLYNNLTNLKISPNLMQSLERPEIRKLFSFLDFLKIPIRFSNPNFYLFGGNYDHIISPASVRRLGQYLGCPTYLFPTGHFTWPLYIKKGLKMVSWPS
ncbi:MAG: hypothetical protein ACXAC7_02245 [Candidatus Hodarchaeales archaeon]|jgi:pimeloyl-ACP methyl ester carboxylesterase